ncbi:hypothetical protein [Microbacterium sp. 18062]|uniref:hypothetical protein n=1 Tax=Microbacterium sp. 18062 TaxID=2681410 RepID=UPI0013585EBB|nr:hypothetical protein [Microbacterium sp. 18062]
MPLTRVPAPEPSAAVPLPLSARAGLSPRPATAGIALDLGGAALPEAVRDLARERWALDVTTAPGAVDPWGLPAVGALLGQARAEQVIRAFSARTNLSLAGARVAVVGDGPIAAALSTALTRIGSRVLVVSGSPLPRLRARLAGLADAPPDELGPAHLDHVFHSGEADEPISVPGAGRLLVDASPAGAAIPDAASAHAADSGDGDAATADAARSGVHAVVGGGWRVDPPPLISTAASGNGLSGLDRHVADVIVAFALLTTQGETIDPDRADAQLAELVIA